MAYGVLRARGDYGVRARRRRGDPGFLGTLGSIIGAGVSAVIPGAAPVLAGIKAITAGRGKSAGVPVLPAPGLGGLVQRLVPGGQTGLIVPGGGAFGRGRRMNPANGKALNRAIRRINSFGSLVQRSKKAVAKANRAIGNVSRRAPIKARR